MVNEPRPEQLTVDTFRDFLSECHDRSVVGLRLSASDVEWLCEGSERWQGDLLCNLRIASEPGGPGVWLTLRRKVDGGDR